MQPYARPRPQPTASALPVKLPDGTRAYGAHFVSGANQGYRIDISNSVARGNEAETISMVTAGDLYNYKCCFDFGNAEANNLDTGEGSMEVRFLVLVPARRARNCIPNETPPPQQRRPFISARTIPRARAAAAARARGRG